MILVKGPKRVLVPAASQKVVVLNAFSNPNIKSRGVHSGEVIATRQGTRAIRSSLSINIVDDVAAFDVTPNRLVVLTASNEPTTFSVHVTATPNTEGPDLLEAEWIQSPNSRESIVVVVKGEKQVLRSDRKVIFDGIAFARKIESEIAGEIEIRSRKNGTQRIPVVFRPVSSPK